MMNGQEMCLWGHRGAAVSTYTSTLIVSTPRWNSSQGLQYFRKSFYPSSERKTAYLAPWWGLCPA